MIEASGFRKRIYILCYDDMRFDRIKKKNFFSKLMLNSRLDAKKFSLKLGVAV
jgi:hypothetical protein